MPPPTVEPVASERVTPVSDLSEPRAVPASTEMGAPPPHMPLAYLHSSRSGAPVFGAAHHGSAFSMGNALNAIGPLSSLSYIKPEARGEADAAESRVPLAPVASDGTPAAPEASKTVEGFKALETPATEEARLAVDAAATEPEVLAVPAPAGVLVTRPAMAAVPAASTDATEAEADEAAKRSALDTLEQPMPAALDKLDAGKPADAEAKSTEATSPADAAANEAAKQDVIDTLEKPMPEALDKLDTQDSTGKSAEAPADASAAESDDGKSRRRSKLLSLDARHLFKRLSGTVEEPPAAERPADGATLGAPHALSDVPPMPVLGGAAPSAPVHGPQVRQPEAVPAPPSMPVPSLRPGMIVAPQSQPGALSSAGGSPHMLHTPIDVPQVHDLDPDVHDISEPALPPVPENVAREDDELPPLPEKDVPDLADEQLSRRYATEEPVNADDLYDAPVAEYPRFLHTVEEEAEARADTSLAGADEAPAGDRDAALPLTPADDRDAALPLTPAGDRDLPLRPAPALNLRGSAAYNPLAISQMMRAMDSSNYDTAVERASVMGIPLEQIPSNVPTSGAPLMTAAEAEQAVVDQIAHGEPPRPSELFAGKGVRWEAPDWLRSQLYQRDAPSQGDLSAFLKQRRQLVPPTFAWTTAAPAAPSPDAAVRPPDAPSATVRTPAPELPALEPTESLASSLDVFDRFLASDREPIDTHLMDFEQLEQTYQGKHACEAPLPPAPASDAAPLEAAPAPASEVPAPAPAEDARVSIQSQVEQARRRQAAQYHEYEQSHAASEPPKAGSLDIAPLPPAKPHEPASDPYGGGRPLYESYEPAPETRAKAPESHAEAPADTYDYAQQYELFVQNPHAYAQQYAQYDPEYARQYNEYLQQYAAYMQQYGYDYAQDPYAWGEPSVAYGGAEARPVYGYDAYYGGAAYGAAHVDADPAYGAPQPSQIADDVAVAPLPRRAPHAAASADEWPARAEAHAPGDTSLPAATSPRRAPSRAPTRSASQPQDKAGFAQVQRLVAKEQGDAAMPTMPSVPKAPSTASSSRAPRHKGGWSALLNESLTRRG